MAIRWSPNTCGCVLLAENDMSTGIPEAKCERHAAIPDDGTFQAVKAENMLFNLTMGALKERYPELEVAGGHNPWEIDVDWYFTATGLTVVLPEGIATDFNAEGVSVEWSKSRI